MAKQFNVSEAKTHFSKLLKRVADGEEVIIARAGVPVVRLVPVLPPAKRKLGQWRGQVQMSEEFDEPLDRQDLDAWEGRS